MESLEEVSRLVREGRAKLGLSQKKLSKYVHMSQSTIARLESDIESLNPSYSTVLKVISTLDSLSAIGARKGILNRTAAEIMHKRIVYAKPGDTVAQTIRVIREYDFPQLPVLNGDMTVIGAVSQKRLMSIATKRPEMLDKIRVSQIVDEEIPMVGKDTDTGRIKRILENWEAVLIVERGKAIGIITIYDILKLL